MSMEKITKDELLKKLDDLALSDDELEQVTGGAQVCLSGFVWSHELQRCVLSALK